jgi:H3 lysine-79-specific histone-lysine N-methyltransferase
MTAIFDVKERPYHSGSVSWGNGGGSYFIHRVDRAGYSAVKQKYEEGKGALRTRSSRRKPSPGALKFS